MKQVKTSLVLNILIVILVLLGSIFMFTGFNFMGVSRLLSADHTQMFKFFTVDSNILVGIISFILIIYECMYINYKIDKIPNWVYILKQMATVGVTLTFLVTLLYLAPTAKTGFLSLYTNTNLFFHLIVPLLAMISYIFYERYNNLLRYALLGVIPMFIYSIYYVINIMIHINASNIYLYDFYGFTGGKINNIIIVYPIMILITYIISLILTKLNNRFSK